MPVSLPRRPPSLSDSPLYDPLYNKPCPQAAEPAFAALLGVTLYGKTLSMNKWLCLIPVQSRLINGINYRD